MSELKPEEKKPDEIPDSVVEFSADDMPFTPSYVQKMYEFFQRENIDQNEPTYYLYKYENEASKRRKIVDRYQDVVPPDEHDIGMKFGSGKYILVLIISPNEMFPKGTSRGFQFFVDKVYDERVKASTPAAPPVQQQLPVIQYPPNQTNLLDTISMIEKIVGMVSPLLMQKTSTSGIDTAMRENYKVMGEIMKETMMENFKMISGFQNNQLKQIEQEQNTEPEAPPIIQQFLPIIMEWLPKLMGNDIQAKLTGNIVKSIPQIKDIVNDSQQLDAIVNYLVETQGVESTQQILQNLGIPYEQEDNFQDDNEISYEPEIPLNAGGNSNVDGKNVQPAAQTAQKPVARRRKQSV